MQVEVRLFAVFRERAGRDTLTLEVGEGSTVADVLAAAAREPGLGEILERMPVRAALNREYVDSDAPVAAGDELALVLPVSGGEAATVHARVTDEPHFDRCPRRGREPQRRRGDGGVLRDDPRRRRALL